MKDLDLQFHKNPMTRNVAVTTCCVVKDFLYIRPFSINLRVRNTQLL